MKNFSYLIPTKLLFGFGSLQNLHMEKMPGKKALIVITNGKSIKTNGYLDKVIKELELSNVEYTIFDEVKPNPSLQNIMDGAKVSRENNCDFVVGLGGGSAMDASKAIAIMSTNDGNYWDYQGGMTGKGKKVTNDPLPIICITTTAGTGSEIDQWTVTTNEETNEKMGFGILKTYPTISVVDPELMMSVPKTYTAYQGFDALFHACESVINKAEHPMGEMFAIKAIEYVGKYLPLAYEDGQNREARYYMALANTLAGYYMLTTSEHTFEHSLSAIKNSLPHGAGLIMISKAYHEFFVNKHVCDEKYIQMARALGNENAKEAMDFIVELEKLKEKCNVKDLKLSDFGILESDIDKLTDITYEMGKARFKLDPYEMNKEDVREIFKNAYK